MKPDKVVAARKLLGSGMSARAVATAVGVSLPTLYRHLGGAGDAGRIHHHTPAWSPTNEL